MAVILAGGEGRRMGGADKAHLMLAGRPLISHVIARLSPQISAAWADPASADADPDPACRIMISANGDPARFSSTGLKVLADEASYGPLSGILSGLRAAQAAGAAAVISTPVDAPFLPDTLVSALMAAVQSPAGSTKDAAFLHPTFARAGGRDHNASALWPVALADPLAAFLASGAKPKIADFAAMHGAVAVDFPDPEGFANLNRPEDLARAESRMSADQVGRS
ncbi:molybdenum cofactor guanylyltransferase [Xinfangfangia sp. D13-10-4-6]|uniref:molybdenum cofactor guanylyltransferase n=1 Tax=Pseudogemmobacter hezensis TaxID=2737662 RepID=UPI001C1306D2|nr:molybdenum cofactor guanylyltransferase [Pseudogemmobacter hezensis]NPD17251.1 molybdenum cofactor guanylyltransferase [Pseudogemmobacter hezensis]